MFHSLRYALRMMRLSPGFTAVAVLTLGLGVGANTAIFSVVDALLLRPLPLADPQRLLLVSASFPGRFGSGGPFSLIAYENIRDHSHAFSGIAAFAGEGFTVTGAGDPERLAGARVASNFFNVLQARPMMGRVFQAAEGEAGGKPVVLISHSLWQRRFASDPEILGKPVTLGQESYTIIGVMPPEFPFPFPATDIWASRMMHYTGLTAEQIRNGAGYLTAIARLSAGTSESQAAAEIAVLDRQYRQEHPGNPDADPAGRLDLTPLQESLVTGIRPTLLILSAAVGFVLLIACANVASLMLARASGRAREFAIRAALGADRAVLIRQLLGESVLLAIAGGAFGVLLATWGVSLLVQSSGGNLPGFEPIRVDLRVLGFTLAVSLLTGLAFGLMPALQISRPDLNGVLRDSGWGTTRGVSRHRARSLLVAGQMALSIVLLIGAGLLVESFGHLQTVNPGFNPRNALTMRVSLPPAGYPDDARRSQFVRALMDRIQHMPGVISASASSGLPLTLSVFAPYLAEGQPLVPIGQRPIAAWNAVSPGYFKTLGIPLARGRDFSWADDEKASPKIIVSQSLARRFWPNDDPIGKHITYARREVVAEIVGVAGDVKGRGLDSEPGIVFYTPYPQFAWPSLSITIRTAGDPRGLFRAAPAQVFALDRNLPVVNTQTAQELIDQTLSQRRQTMYLIAGFAAVALLLAVVGVYGVMAYSVARRRTEIGIRQAIGARRGDVLWMVLAQSLRLSLAGAGLGTAAAVASTRLISGLLFQVSATDPRIYAGISILFIAVMLAASYIPALRATRVDPLEALRAR